MLDKLKDLINDFKIHPSSDNLFLLEEELNHVYQQLIDKQHQLNYQGMMIDKHITMLEMIKNQWESKKKIWMN